MLQKGSDYHAMQIYQSIYLILCFIFLPSFRVACNYILLPCTCTYAYTAHKNVVDIPLHAEVICHACPLAVSMCLNCNHNMGAVHRSRCPFILFPLTPILVTLWDLVCINFFYGNQKWLNNVELCFFSSLKLQIKLRAVAHNLNSTS